MMKPYLILASLFSVALLTIGCNSQRPLTEKQRQNYYKEWEVVDSVKFSITLYEVIDTAVYKALDIVFDYHIKRQGTFPAIIQILPILVNKDSIMYRFYCSEFSERGTLEDVFDNNPEKYFAGNLGAFYYKNNLILLQEKSVHNPREGESYDYIVNNIFRNTGKKAEFYHRFASGPGAETRATFLYQDGKFILLKIGDGILLWR